MATITRTSSSAGAASSASSKPSGDVDVLSAGSLDTLMTKADGPAFHAATGYPLVGTSAARS
jgi:hypothetical protein